MRRIVRTALPGAAQAYLNKRQLAVNRELGLRTLNVGRDWKIARKTKSLGAVLYTLRRMTGPRERCMYCVDSHGCDIEHFRPKITYPKRAFQWSNLLLCCTECGRFKGDQFPTANGRPLLIDPTTEDPWQHLDFDPDTGNLTARFDIQANGWSAKGAKTVEVFRFDRREALSNVYQATFRRLCRIVQVSLAANAIDALVLLPELQEADDHGMLPWCFGLIGQTVAPFSTLHQQHPKVWADCLHALK
jgi:uncharacterized protein (TIGR02646 family)